MDLQKSVWNTKDSYIGDFLEILRFALSADVVEEKPNLSDSVNWELLETVAKAHNLFPLFYEVATLFSEYKSRELYGESMKLAMVTVASQIKKTKEFLELYRDFLQEELHPIVMKGIICRDIYGKYAEKRVSGDEDILVPKTEFFDIKKVMEARGYVCEFEEVTDAQIETMQHIIFEKPESRNIIEVHVNAMGHRNEMRSQMNDCFEDAFSDMRVQMIKDVPIYTFSHTKHFLFLIMHSVKHFVEGGVGIRQMLDILLYQKNYEDEIDWEIVKIALKDTHTEGFLGDIQYIGMHFLGCEFRECFQETCPDVLLRDTIDAGVFGHKEADDTVAASITMEVLNHKKRGLYAWFRAGFPSRRVMVDAYPYLQEKPWVLPIEWIKRWMRFVKKAGRHDGNLMLDGFKKSQNRMKMLKKYGL